MAIAIEAGHVPMGDIRDKMGTFDKIPEIDFVPFVGSYIGTISEWDLDKRIYNLKQITEKQTMDKETKEALAEIEAFSQDVSLGGRSGDRKFFGSFLVIFRKRLEAQNVLLKDLIKSIDKNTKAVSELAKKVKKG
jgi:hypothetical protein